MAEVLLLERQGGIALVTLNRPEALNALSRELYGRLRATFAALEDDDAVKVVVVQGAGGRAFSVGIDLKERQNIDDAEADAIRSGLVFPFYLELNERKKPYVAAVDGFALGGGFELALGCDALIASDRSQFGLPEVRWGMIPAGGGLQLLTRAVGPLRAKEMAMTGRRVGAAEAERMGFLNRVVPAQDLLKEAMATAEAIAGNEQRAVRGVKSCIDRLTEFRSGFQYDIEVSNVCYASQGRRQALGTFGAKPAPDGGRK